MQIWQGYKPKGNETHDAIDIAVRGGTGDIISPTGGKVVYVTPEDNPTYGKQVVVFNQETGEYYGYSHNKSNSVKTGDTVNPGTVIGTIGGEGVFAQGRKHIHYSVLKSTDSSTKYDHTKAFNADWNIRNKYYKRIDPRNASYNKYR